jgi:hypothetical protein
VSSGRRPTRTLEFTPPDDGEVTAALAQLRATGDGWINLLPGIPEDFVDEDQPSGIFAFFGARAAPVTMATVMPARKDRRASEGVTIGVMHPTGGKAAARLAEAGIELPAGWVVRQDHARRGLLVRTPASVSEDNVVAWCVRAGTELCRAPMTGQWRAVVYLPRAA